MEVYERKISGLEVDTEVLHCESGDCQSLTMCYCQARERQLQELLQSKNSALQYSERFLAQYRSQKGEVESEVRTGR